MAEPEDPPPPPPDEPAPPAAPRLGIIDGGAGKPQKRPAVAVTRDKYDRMLEAYVRGNRSTKQTARVAGVAPATARKAIFKGWPEKGWPPLRQTGELYDKAAAANQSAPADPGRQEEAASWTDVRRQHLRMALQLRATLARAMIMLNEALADSTARVMKPRRTVHYEEHLDKAGHVVRRIPRTMVEDVEHKPNLLAVVAALGDAGGILRGTGAHEIGMANSRDPIGLERKPGWSALTQEQMQYIEETGRLPPGVTLDQLERG